MMRNPIILFFLLLVSFLSYTMLAHLGDLSNQIDYYLLIVSILIAIYMILVILTLRSKNNLPLHWAWFMVSAFLSRLVLIPTSPTLAHDVNRYIWSAETILITKIFLLLVETVLVFLLAKILNHFSLSINRLIIFIFNPLVVIETYHSGHTEIVGIMLFWVAIFYFYIQKDRYTFAGIMLSAVVKPLTLLTAIPFLYKKFWRKFIFLVLICIMFLILFNKHDRIFPTGVLPTPEHGVFLGAIFTSISFFMDLLGLPGGEITIESLGTININSVFYYMILTLLVLIIVAFDRMRKLKVTADYRSINYLQAGFILAGTGILLLPHLPPWYLIVIIPFLLFLPNWSWLIFTGLIQLSYYALNEYAATGNWQESHLILMLIYIPFYTLLIWEYLDRRQIKGWFLS